MQVSKKQPKAEGKADFDAMAKVAIIGDSSVGKTNILLRYINSNYQPNHVVTIGIDFKVKLLTLDGFKLKMQIWDTAGQQRFRNLTGTIYQGAQGIILVYSVTNRKSFNNVEVWMQDLANHSKTDIILAIIGNKCDLDSEREVTKEQGMELAQKNKAQIFLETSAKEGVNIDALFEKVGRKIRDKIMLNEKKQQKKAPPAPTKKTRAKSVIMAEKNETGPMESVRLNQHAHEKTKKAKKNCEC